MTFLSNAVQRLKAALDNQSEFSDKTNGNDAKKVVTRFAPSPTGFMHIGGVRTALFAYLWAKKNNGTFILRIEDTDRSRLVEGSLEHIQESLQWLGLEWDLGPDKPGAFGSLIQSERLNSFKKAAQELYEKGLAYPDPFTKEELEALRADAQGNKQSFLVREHRPKTFAAWDGKSALRLKQTNVERKEWHDAVRGKLSGGPEMLDDFVILKADGFPTYNFAHIVDDAAMGVTHVFRADEFISSTPNYLALYEALGISPPIFVTLPPILREDRTKKLGKRDGARDILEYRADGFLPEAMVNFLAFIGWNPGDEREVFSPGELMRAFTLEGIQKAGAIVNEDKLLWFNREHLLRLSENEFAHAALEKLKESLSSRVIWNEDMGKKLVPLVRERIDIWKDIAEFAETGEFDYFFAPPSLDAARIPDKKSAAADAAEHLAHALEILDTVSPFDADNVKNALWDYATEKGRGAVLWPLRYSLSGREKSPDPFTLMNILGKEESLTRIKAAQALLV